MVRAKGSTSKAVPFARDTLAECLEQEPNNSPQSAQQVPPALVINGRIGQPGDVDVFRFDARAGQTIVAEVQGRRLRSPIDSMLRLTDANGRQLAFNDDREDKGAGLTTHHADSWLRHTLPRNGTYYVYLRDTQRRGGEDYGYRLRISAPRPDFDLRVMPSSINIRAGQTLPITVHAVRKDGFTGGIALTLPDAPPGFRLSGARVPPNQDRVQLTLTAPPRGFAQPVALRLEGYARIRGQEVVRQAVAADDVMQAFLYRHLVPVTELLVSVTGRGGRLPLQIVADEPVRIPAGCMTQLRVRVAGTQRGRGRGRGRGARNQPALRYQLELRNPPPGVTIYDVSKARDGADITLLADPTKIQPGTQGNLIFQVFAAPPTPPRNAPQRRRQVRRRLVAILPAVRFEVLPE
ncbi:MAG: PPC domain-containing protein [Planctomycetota bacterium]